MTRDAGGRQYIESAVRFQPRAGGRIRVASTLLTCGTAAALLDALQLPPELDTAYRFVNVHNPRCPLRFDRAQGRWQCDPAFERHPAWGFNWAGAQLLCGALGARLPTVAEWMAFASNNEPGRPYPWGDDEPRPAIANYDEHYGGTSEVTAFPASELGLHDLAGNLCEWCLDRFTVNGTESAFERVVKGGAWSKDARHLRIDAQRGKWERIGTTTIGVRPVWDDA